MITVNAANLSRKPKSSLFRMAGPIAAIILILTGSLVGAAASSENPSFFKTCRAFQKLSKDPSGNREGWLRVVRSFLSIHRTNKNRRAANRSLFLAGKASLDLYRRSGKVEDLDEAIRHLSRFSDLNRRGPNLILGLRELKEAHSLKRKIPDVPTRRAHNSQEVNPSRTDVSWQGHAQAAYKNRRAEASDGSANTVGSRINVCLRAPRWHKGNPYGGATVPYPSNFKLGSDRESPSTNSKGNSRTNTDLANPIATDATHSAPANSLPGPQQRTVGRDLSAPVKSAALPRPTINDGRGRKKVANSSVKEFVVAIDPGHGGKDPGAVSHDGRLKEKDLTLKIAKRLKTALENENPPIKVVLTRSDDRHLSLDERIALANSANADLFISIHCNSAEDSSSRGIETYYLSKASSRGAMKVAARENGIPLSKMSDVEATLVDLMVTSKKSESAKLAISVHSALSHDRKSVGLPARDRGVRQAPFYVLLGAKMPAILVECAFISNKRERGRLASPAYLVSIAEKIADGAANYVKGLDSRG
jgi:N-acetylmuramoyl-L-alanine amidase